VAIAAVRFGPEAVKVDIGQGSIITIFERAARCATKNAMALRMTSVTHERESGYPVVVF
jgi:hypothetical protein